jgi:hypothetical protein
MPAQRSRTSLGARHEKDLQHHPLWILEPELFEAVLHIVSKHDLENIITGANPRGWTEYAPEVEAILPLLKHASRVADVEKSIRLVFRNFFGSVPHQSTAMSGEIWKFIRRPDHQRALQNIVNLEVPIQNAVNRIRKLHPKSDDPLRLALVAALDKQALSLKAEKYLKRIFGDDPV